MLWGVCKKLQARVDALEKPKKAKRLVALVTTRALTAEAISLHSASEML